METKVNYTLVGAFVIFLFTCIILTIIWLSSGLSLQSNVIYQVYMSESVSGLGIDSSVEYNGVNVGTVTSIELNHQNPQLVELLLSIKANTPITQGTVATLRSRGLTGIASLALKDNGTDTRPLKKLPGDRYPVIPTSPSLFFRLDSALTNLTLSLQTLLNKESLHSIKEIIKNLREVTDALAVNTQQIRTILQNTAKASNTFTMQTLPAANQTLLNLNTLSRNLEQISFELKQNPSILIRGKAQTTLGPGEN